MNIYCFFEKKDDPTLDYKIYLLFISDLYTFRLFIHTRDFNEDHIYNILTQDIGVEKISGWNIIFTTSDNGVKYVYFNNIESRLYFCVDFNDIKDCFIKIYEKVKI